MFEEKVGDQIAVSKANNEERREALHEKVDSKVEIISDLSSFVRQKSVDCEPEDFKKESRQKFEEIKNSFNEEVVEKYAEFIELEKRCDEISGQRDLEDEIDFVDKMALYDERDKMLEDVDVKFLYKTGEFLRSIEEKVDRTFEAKNLYKKNTPLFWKNLVNKTGFDLRNENKEGIEVRFVGYGVNIVLPDSLFVKVINDNKILGCHMRGSIYNIITDRLGENEVEEALEHENKHNLLESLSGSSDYFKEALEKVEKRGEILTRSDLPENMLDNVRKQLKNYIQDYHTKIYEELAANLDSSQELSSFVYNYKQTIAQLKASQSKIIDDDKSREIFKEALSSSMENFINYISTFSDILYASKTFGMEGKGKFALILFGSKEIHKVKRYVKYLVGEENYDIAKILRPVVSKEQSYMFEEIQHWGKPGGNSPPIPFFDESEDFYSDIREKAGSETKMFFNFGGLKKLNELLDQKEKEGDKEDLEKIKELVSKSVGFHPSQLLNANPDLLDINNMLEYDTQLKKLVNLLSSSDIEELRKGLFKEFLEEAIEKEGFSNLKKIFQDDFDASRKLEIEGYLLDVILVLYHSEGSFKLKEFLNSINLEKDTKSVLQEYGYL